ncbi:MAG TPA: hypothetical protein VF369_06250 [candidate division Zixibacteria bacterium]
MNRKKYHYSFGLPVLLILLIGGCVGKKPDDDVELIKKVLAGFERGIDQKDTAVLDSLVLDKKKNLSSRLLDSLSQQGEYENASILSKSFIIYQDSAEVRLKLGLKLKSAIIIQGEEIREIDKQVKLLLNKKRGKWKIRDFNILPTEE